MTNSVNTSQHLPPGNPTPIPSSPEETAFLKDVGSYALHPLQGRYLPHLFVHGGIYHVRFSLVDALPRTARDELLREKARLVALSKNPEAALTPVERKRLLKSYAEKVEDSFDAGWGSC